MMRALLFVFLVSFLLLGCKPIGKASDYEASDYSSCDHTLEQCAQTCSQQCAANSQCPDCLNTCSSQYETCQIDSP